MTTIFLLTPGQKRELEWIKIHRTIAQHNLTGQRERIYKTLFNMRLLNYKNGEYSFKEKFRVVYSEKQIDNFVLGHHVKHGRRAMANMLKIAESKINASCKRLGLGPSKVGRPAVKRAAIKELMAEEKKPAIKRPPADHTNISREYYVNKYLNAEIKTNFHYR